MARVEALSLQSITDLASNPPHQPALGPHAHPTSLELYIVRVPGSRDVFLTPLKPRDRVVNAQDVQSSLYFLHVEDHQDQQNQHDDFDSDIEPSLLEPDSSMPYDELSRTSLLVENAPRHIKRKPLPTPPTSPNLHPDFVFPPLDLERFTAVPKRKPVVPPRSPKRSSWQAPTSPSPTVPDASLSDNTEPSHHLTLIRRDPSTGQQWNIAKIRDPPVDEISSDLPNRNGRVKTSGAPLYLDITNIGYNKFVTSDTQVPRAPPSQGLLDSPSSIYSESSHTSVTSLGPPTPTSTDPPTQPVFTRRMYMPGSRHADHTYGTTSPSFFDRRSRSYAFHDPWGHTCDFLPAPTGRALRCRRHRPRPPPRPTPLHPIDEAPEDATDDLSELRFNLPTHHAKSRSATDVSVPSAVHPALRGDRGHAHARGASAVVTNDYALGREMAGGGFAGREPKLGKLLVHPAGLQMVDLVVAANMGLWWRAYERSCAAAAAAG